MAPKFLNKKGVTLIIVVFAMMLLGILGWTLARMQATDFESNLRTFEPDNALNLAEAGAQYSLNVISQNPCMRTVNGAIDLNGCASTNLDMDTDCSDLSSDWLSVPHSLSPGQYNICVRNSCTTCVPAEEGSIVIVSRGYIPSQSDSRTMRQVKLKIELGNLSNALQTQISDPIDPDYGLFDWTAARAAHIVEIEGHIAAGHYKSDGDGTSDELPPGNPGYDYDPPPSPILPEDISNPENERRDITTSYPSIDMPWFYGNADYIRWPPPSRTISIETTVRDTSSGTDLRVTTPNFFSDGFASPNYTRYMALHNISDDANKNWDNNNWAVIDAYTNGTRVTLNRDVGETWDNDTVRLVLRFYNKSGGTDYSSARFYAGRQAAETSGEPADILIDLNDNSVEFDNSSLISEGDIVIKGPKGLKMSFSPSGLIYPPLATQNGDILSFDLPEGNNENARTNNRRISGLIYSEFGQVYLHYLNFSPGTSTWRQSNLVYGQQIILDGEIHLRYNSAVVPTSGFIFKPAILNWKEE